MTSPPSIRCFEAMLDRVTMLANSGQRRILGITGPPGSGKSTLARSLVRQLGDEVVYVPMDGFHLANAELRRLGRLDRKGADDTFDAAGYVSLLQRLRDPGPEAVYAPRFDREVEEPIACAIAIPRDVPLVVTEGNYLLVDRGPWAAIRALLDEVWYIDLDEHTRVERLVQRHVAFGKEDASARTWVARSDQRNAELVAATRHRADLVVAGPCAP